MWAAKGARGTVSRPQDLLPQSLIVLADPRGLGGETSMVWVLVPEGVRSSGSQQGVAS